MTTHPTSPSRRRSPWPWAIGGAALTVAVVLTLVLTSGDDSGTGSGTDGGARDAAPTTTTTGSRVPGGYDLSTPQAAAESFAAAAATGSGETLLELACVGRPACAGEHAADVDEARLSEVRNTIRDGVYELAQHLDGAEFTSAVDGTEPGTKDIPYRTPAMTGDAYLTLTFVQSDGDWLYYQPAT
jgi:hypothetical protein